MGERNIDAIDMIEDAVYKLEFIAAMFANLDADHCFVTDSSATGLMLILNGIIEDLNRVNGMWEDA
jgi:hypothetical protein